MVQLTFLARVVLFFFAPFLLSQRLWFCCCCLLFYSILLPVSTREDGQEEKKVNDLFANNLWRDDSDANVCRRQVAIFHPQYCSCGCCCCSELIWAMQTFKRRWEKRQCCYYLTLYVPSVMGGVTSLASCYPHVFTLVSTTRLVTTIPSTRVTAKAENERDE